MEVDTTPPQPVTDTTVTNDISITNEATENITEDITENGNNKETKENGNSKVKETKSEHKIPNDYDNRMLWMKGVLENGFSYEHEITKKEKQAQENLLNEKKRYYTENNPEEISIFEECLERNNRENYNKLKKFLNNEIEDATMLIFYTEKVTVENEVAKKHYIKHKRSRFMPKEEVVETKNEEEDNPPEEEEVKKSDTKKKGKNDKPTKGAKKTSDKKADKKGADKKTDKKSTVDKNATTDKNEAKSDDNKEEKKEETEEKTEKPVDIQVTEEDKPTEPVIENGEETLPPNFEEKIIIQKIKRESYIMHMLVQDIPDNYT